MVQIMECGGSDPTVNTPNNSIVEANSYSEYSVYDLADIESKTTKLIYDNKWIVTKKDNATGTYNCHSYAWYMSEGGTNTYWINASTRDDYNISYLITLPGISNISKYWTDGSYIEVPESVATKVFYGSCGNWGYIGQWIWDDLCDHSAVRITSGPNAGLYESKWGSAGRYIHQADESPYTITNRRYFLKNPNLLH